MTTSIYRRVIVKISGQSLSGPDDAGVDSAALGHVAAEIVKVQRLGVEVGVMVGGGNIFRGSVAEDWGIDRAEADHVGMLGTAINALLLRGTLTAMGATEVRVMTALPIHAVAEPYIRLRAVRHLEKGRIVLFACGIGQPYVTTDYPAVQRALEVQSDALLVAKHGVDGVYTGDPRRDPSAEFLPRLTYDDVIRRDLTVMDQTAFVLARNGGLPIHVFDVARADFMVRICGGETLGTYISKDGPGPHA